MNTIQSVPEVCREVVLSGSSLLPDRFTLHFVNKCQRALARCGIETDLTNDYTLGWILISADVQNARAEPRMEDPA